MSRGYSMEIVIGDKKKKEIEKKFAHNEQEKGKYNFKKGDWVYRPKDKLTAQIIEIYLDKGSAALRDNEGMEYGASLNDLEPPVGDKLVDAIIKNTMTEDKLERQVEFLREVQNEGIFVLQELKNYLTLQKKTEESFNEMINRKKEQKKKLGKNYNSDNDRTFQLLKNEWEDNKNDLGSSYRPTEFLEIEPEQIDEKMRGEEEWSRRSYNYLKIIRKLNLGTLNSRQREGLLDVLKELIKEKKERVKKAA